MTNDVAVIDLTTYKERFGQRVAPGRYRVVIEDAELTVASTGSKGIEVWLTCTEGDFAGSTITDRLYYEKDGKPSPGIFRLVQLMQAAGLPTPKKRFQLPLRQMIGRTIDIDVEDGEPYNNRVRSEVQGYMRAGDSQTDQGDDLTDLSGLGEFAPEPEEPPAELFEDISSEPTDYDEDLEPEKVAAAEANKKAELAKEAKPTPAPAPQAVQETGSPWDAGDLDIEGLML